MSRPPATSRAVEVHASAIVEDGARIGEGCRIGPFSWIGADAELGAGSVLHSHAVIAGRTRVGPGAEIFPFACIGHRPQDLKYAGEESFLEIGARCSIRENATLHPGTQGGGMHTRVGDDCLIMAGAHVAHDCQIGDHVILVNNATLGGHVRIGDHAIIGGMSAVHQFVRIGAHAMVGGMSCVEFDVIPYGTVMGDRAALSGLNLVGLKRRGFNRDQIHELQKAFRMLFGDEGTLQERLEDVDEVFGGNQLVADIVGFMRADSSRAICQPRNVRVP